MSLSPARIWLSILPLLFIALPPNAEPAATIERVTVYPDRAVVVRRHRIELLPGDHAFEITDLPARLDPESLRVRIDGPTAVRLGPVDTRLLRGSERVHPGARELEARIEERERHRREVDDRIRAAELQLELLQTLATRPGEGELKPETWPDALAAMATGAAEILARRRAAEQQRDTVDRELETLRRQLADLGGAQRDHLAATIHYDSPVAGPALVEIEYSIGQVQWAPVYEWRLDTDRGRLAILQRAVIHQNTGEDWTDASLEVALGRPARGGRLPVLTPWFIDVRSPEWFVHREIRVTAADATAPMPELAGTPFATVYRIPGTVSVPGDGTRRQFELARHDLEARISARTVPRRQTQAWLFASAHYDGDVPLPAGQVTLLQDGAMVGRTAFSGLAPGAALEASFGVDDRISVAYRLQHDRRSTEELVRRQTRQERAYTIEVTNSHRRALDIMVVDQIPNSRDERIRVELTADSDAPTTRDLDDQPGILAWEHGYGPGESRRIRFGYHATYPQDLDGIQGW